MTWRPHPYQIAVIVLEGTLHAAGGEEESSIYSATNHKIYNNDWQEKPNGVIVVWMLWDQSTTLGLI